MKPINILIKNSNFLIYRNQSLFMQITLKKLLHYHVFLPNPIQMTYSDINLLIDRKIANVYSDIQRIIPKSCSTIYIAEKPEGFLEGLKKNFITKQLFTNEVNKINHLQASDKKSK